MDNLVLMSENLFNSAVSQLTDLGYCLEDTCYVIEKSSHYNIYEDDKGSPPPGITLVFGIPKNGYLGICLQIDYKECEHKIWCNTEEQVISVISNFDLIIKYWHNSLVELELRRKC